jgi:hypothetical protein
MKRLTRETDFTDTAKGGGHYVFLFFFFLTCITPQWPVTVSLQRLRGLPRDLLSFGWLVIICRGIRLRSILCRCCFQLLLYWSMCSSAELIFSSQRISVFIFYLIFYILLFFLKINIIGGNFSSIIFTNCPGFTSIGNNWSCYSLTDFNSCVFLD